MKFNTYIGVLRKRTKFFGVVAAAMAFGLFLSACSSTNSSTTTSQTSSSATTSGNVGSQLSSLEKPPSSTVALSETGSTLLYPLFQLWAPDYNKAYSNISVTPSGTGSGTGIAQSATGAVNIGASDAYLSSGQVSQYPGLLNIPLAISAQVIEYNIPGFNGKLNLDGKVLSDIYQGKVTNWNSSEIAAINKGVNLPNLPIIPLHRSDGSGDTFIFTQYLSDADPNGWGQSISYGTSWTAPATSDALAENGNGGMVTGCQATKGCIAYVGISFLDKATSDGLGEAYLGNKAGTYLQPNAQNIQTEVDSFSGKTPPSQAQSLVYGSASQGYPIVNYEYAIVSSNQSSSTTAQAIKAFLAWCMDPAHGNASSYLDQVHFIPLPTASLSQSVAQLGKIS